MLDPHRRPFIRVLDEISPGGLRRWIGAVAMVAAVGYAAGIWINALVEPWSWSRRGPEAAVVLTALLATGLARSRPLAAAVLLLVVAGVELHASFFVYGILGTSKVLAPTLVAATGFILGGNAGYLAALLSAATVLVAAVVDSVQPGFGVVELEHFFYVAVSNAAIAVITAKGLDVFEETARGAEAGRRATADLIHHAPDGILTLDDGGRILTANPAAATMLRQPAGTLEGERFETLPIRLTRVDDGSLPRLADAVDAPVGLEATAPDGRVRRLELSARSFPRADGSTVQLAAMRDITERIESEAREARLDDHIRRTQRLGTVAQLAGGLAHDFNNIFTVIRGAAELVRVEAGEDPDGVRRSADTILEVESRGAELIRQLLTFAGPGEALVETFCPAAEIRQLTPVLEGIAGERIRLALDLDAEGSVVMDRRSFRQVVLNLVANAREAMAGGGEIHIAARDEPGTSHRRFVHLTVADTGEGMDPETVARISEPFFTTRREAGHAGLGFATVHRIVNESGGTLGVDSAPGGGTSVHLRLPAAFDVSGLPDPARA